jgi:uncharacterized protein
VSFAALAGNILAVSEPSGESARPEPRETCPECGARFPCGALAGDDSCWCQAVPNVVPVPLSADARCLCPACLARRVAAAG